MQFLTLYKHHSIFGFASEAGPCLRGNLVFSQAKKIPPRAVGVQWMVYKPFLYIMGLKQPVWGIFTKVAFGPAPYGGAHTNLFGSWAPPGLSMHPGPNFSVSSPQWVDELQWPF